MFSSHTAVLFTSLSDNMGNHLAWTYKVNTIRYIISSFVGYLLFICRQSGQRMGSSDWSNALNSASVKDKEKEMLTGVLMYVAVLRERLYNTHTHTHSDLRGEWDKETNGDVKRQKERS